MYSSVQTPLCVLANIFRKNFNSIDRFTRAVAFKVFIDYTRFLKENELWRIIDEITGGLGYEKENIDLFRVIQVGCLISWAERVSPGARVLEIGTGLGRTMYCILSTVNNVVYYSIDASPIILSIALYRNPFELFTKILWKHNVHLILGDAVSIVDIMLKTGIKFDHIIHDGGPNPKKNPRLYSFDFFNKLVSLLNENGRISIFGGRDPRTVSKIYGILREIGVKAETISYPGIKIRVIRGVK
ncbi:hypothetical protein J4526_03175 [Desulfurococcaceae archaeon MEX13E-LK6-19]|nr:hypothetical protein J4526_03175 [Desulfurococcaceae archaeon MEX13E-LK6-19]